MEIINSTKIGYKSEFAILIISSDKYADIWPIFFYCLRKNWPDCIFSVYLGTNKLVYQDSMLTSTILSGDDQDWSTSLISILDQIKEKYLLVILEDFIITSRVSNDEIISHFCYMYENSINHMHFSEIGLPYDFELNNTYGIYEKGAPYRANVFGFWKKDCLTAILQHGESPWDFEIMGSYRSSGWNNFLSIKNSPFRIINILKKGSYMPASVKECESIDIKLSFEKRKLLNSEKFFKYFIREKYFKYINKVPWKYRVKLMNYLRKALVSY